MTKYKLENGKIFDDETAEKSWDEDTYWDGSNHCSKATGSQWKHEKLYLTAKDAYILVSWSNWQGTKEFTTVMSSEKAAHWLLANGHELPEELATYEEELIA